MRGVMTTALAYGLYGLLAEILVEAWARGAVVRGLATLVLLLYAAFTVVTWKRLGDEVKAGASILVVLLLLALSPWQLGSADAPRALTAFGISAAVLTEVVVLGALLASAAFLLLLPWPARAFRISIIVLALYATLPLAIGVVGHRDFQSIAAGANFLAWVPRWLSGPALGVFVMLPLGALAALHRAIGPFRRQELAVAGRWAFVATAMALCVVMAVPDSIGRAGGPLESRIIAPQEMAIPSANESRAAAAATLAPATRTRLSAQELIQRTNEIARTMRWARYDVAVRAQTLDGIDAAFAFVRDRVRYEAYSGVLRGAEGTYIARAGNAADRSILLAEFLRLKGIKTRFAVGHLTMLQAEALFNRIFEAGKPLETDAVGSTPVNRDATSFLRRVRTRAARDYGAVRTALGNEMPIAPSLSHDEVLKTIELHTWVQAEIRGQWTDLDPAFPDSRPGRTYAVAESTYDELPIAAYQQVTIRVIAEDLSGGTLQQTIALEYRAPAANLTDRQIFLAHVPPSSTGLQGGLAGGIKAAQGGEVWTPLLWIDGAAVAGVPVAYTDQPAAGRQPGPPSGGLSGIFGPGGALSTGRQFVAEWIEFEIAFPNGRRDVSRRVLIDRAGAAWRQSPSHDAHDLRPVSRDDDGLIAPRRLYNIWFSAGRHHLAGYAEAARLLVHLTGPRAAKATGAAPSTNVLLWVLAMENFPVLIWSDHVLIPSLNDSPDYRFYTDSPRIIIISVGPDVHAGQRGTLMDYDLHRDALRGVARQPGAQRAVAARAMWFGTLEGALEQEIVADYAAGTGTGALVTSTSSLLTRDGTAVLRSADDVARLHLDPDTAGHVTTAISGGRVLVVPKSVLRQGARGWWEVGPDGQTRAVLDEDLHGVRNFNGKPLQGGTRGPAGQVSEDVFEWSDEEMQQALNEAAKDSVDYVDKHAVPKPTPKFRPGGSSGGEKKTGPNEYFMMIAVGVVLVAVALGVMYWIGRGIRQRGHAIDKALSGGQQADGSPP
jgi:transglutaminase-like putative cysteine protease